MQVDVLEQLLAAMHAAGRMPKDDRADTCLLQDKMGVLQEIEVLSEAKAKVIAGLRREQQELTKAEKLLAKAASVSGAAETALANAQAEFQNKLAKFNKWLRGHEAQKAKVLEVEAKIAAAIDEALETRSKRELKTYMEKEVAELTQELEGVRASVAAVLAAVDKTEAEAARLQKEAHKVEVDASLLGDEQQTLIDQLEQLKNAVRSEGQRLKGLRSQG